MTNQPNILLLTIDTLRADFISFAQRFGINQLPNLTWFKKNGIWFENAYSHSPWTGTSFATLLTSQYLKDHELYVNKRRENEPFVFNSLNSNIPYLPEIMKENDYYTYCLQGNNGWLTKEFGFCRGFDEYLAQSPYLPSYANFFRKVRNLLFPDTEDQLRTMIVSTYELFARELVRLLKDVVTQIQEPYFLWINFMDPHAPYGMPQNWLKFFISYALSNLKLLNTPFYAMKLENMNKRLLSIAQRNYAKEIAIVDRYIGEVINTLAKKNLLRNTFIFFLSDHGEEFNEHRRIDYPQTKDYYHRGYEHGHTLYNELIKVPFSIITPNFQRGSIKENVGLIDVTPTILKLIKDDSSSIHNHKEQDLLQRNGKGSLIISEGLFYGVQRLSVIQGNFKLIVKPENSGFNMIELYNLYNDPKEYKNLAQVNNSKVEELLKILKMFEIKIPEESQKKEVDSIVLERLRNLGYL